MDHAIETLRNAAVVLDVVDPWLRQDKANSWILYLFLMMILASLAMDHAIETLMYAAVVIDLIVIVVVDPCLGPC